jgi:hypothetical protein
MSFRSFLITVVLACLSASNAYAGKVGMRLFQDNKDNELTSPVETIHVGDSFFLQFYGYDFDDLEIDGGGIDVQFDPRFLRLYTGGDESVVKFDGVWSFFSEVGEVSPETGEIRNIVFNQLGRDVRKSFGIGHVKFLAIAPGTGVVELSSPEQSPFGANANAVDVEFQTLSFQIAPAPAIPEPSTWMLVFTGLALVSFARRSTSHTCKRAPH